MKQTSLCFWRLGNRFQWASRKGSFTCYTCWSCLINYREQRAFLYISHLLQLKSKVHLQNLLWVIESSDQYKFFLTYDLISLLYADILYLNSLKFLLVSSLHLMASITLNLKLQSFFLVTNNV